MIAYSVVISIFGESTLFARAAHYVFIPKHLPLYALLAVLIAVVASIFLADAAGVQRLSARLPLPVWAAPRGRWARPRPVGGAAHPCSSAVTSAPRVARSASSGAATAPRRSPSPAPTGLPGAGGAPSFCSSCAARSCSRRRSPIGTGGSAGDFGPSLVLGGLFGGAFGRAAAVLLHDPSIDPGAFALVGMGTFYGGLAHVPVSSLIMVSELAGSYDLLVPLMLAEGIAFVALRKRFLYDAQVPTHADSPVHRPAASLEVLSSLHARDVMTTPVGHETFEPGTPIGTMLRALTAAPTRAPSRC